VRVVIAGTLPDPGAVDDVVHEAFVTAYLKLRDYRPGTDLVAWVRAIARNLAHNERRRWLRQRSMQQRYLVEIEERARVAIDAATDKLGAEAMHSLRGCVDALAAPARAVVEQFYSRG